MNKDKYNTNHRESGEYTDMFYIREVRYNTRLMLAKTVQNGNRLAYSHDQGDTNNHHYNDADSRFRWRIMDVGDGYIRLINQSNDSSGTLMFVDKIHDGDYRAWGASDEQLKFDSLFFPPDDKYWDILKFKRIRVILPDRYPGEHYRIFTKEGHILKCETGENFSSGDRSVYYQSASKHYDDDDYRFVWRFEPVVIDPGGEGNDWTTSNQEASK
ncbi:hypothetical protein [Azospirillum doebereinerae]